MRQAQATPQHRAPSARAVLRVLVLAGVSLAAWLLCLVFASDAHAAETDDDHSADTAEHTTSGILEPATRTLDSLLGGTAEQHNADQPEHTDTAESADGTLARLTDTVTDAVTTIVHTGNQAARDAGNEVVSHLPETVLPGQHAPKSPDNTTDVPADDTNPAPTPPQSAQDHRTIPSEATQRTNTAPSDSSPVHRAPPRYEPTPAQPSTAQPSARSGRTGIDAVRDSKQDQQSDSEEKAPRPVDDPVDRVPDTPAQLAATTATGHDSPSSGRTVPFVDAGTANIVEPGQTDTVSATRAQGTRDNPALPHASPD